MILKRTAGHWYRRLVGRAWNKWYGDFLWDKQVRRTLAWVEGHWWRRQQGAAWNKWWAKWLHFKQLHPLRSERNRLLEHVAYHIDENGKLVKHRVALENELKQQVNNPFESSPSPSASPSPSPSRAGIRSRG